MSVKRALKTLPFKHAQGSSYGLSWMARWMPFGLRISIRYWMITKRWLWLTVTESRCLRPASWCLKCTTWTTPPQPLCPEWGWSSWAPQRSAGDPFSRLDEIAYLSKGSDKIHAYVVCFSMSSTAFIQGWTNTRNAKEAESILVLYDRIFEDAYSFMKQSLKPKMELLECNYISQVCVPIELTA